VSNHPPEVPRVEFYGDGHSMSIRSSGPDRSGTFPKRGRLQSLSF